MKHSLKILLVAAALLTTGLLPAQNRTMQFVQGFAKPITALQNQNLLARAVDGENVIEWESDPLPASSKQPITLVWSGLISNIHLADKAEVSLYANNKRVASFKTGEAKSFSLKGPSGEQFQFALQSFSRRSVTGFMTLTLPAGSYPSGKPILFKLAAKDLNESNAYVAVTAKSVDLAQLDAPIKSIVYPALTKNNKQIVSIDYFHSGTKENVTLTIDGKKQTMEAYCGKNTYKVYLDPVAASRNVEVTVRSSAGEKKTMLALAPLSRKWQVNMVQHTHTDIGYTRPQHEILAEHIRYIDTALDYCDQTDHLPDDAKFRWTCEAAFAVEEFLRTRPQEQIDRLLRRIKEGRIDVMAMYFNFDELPDERSLAQSLKPLKMFEKYGIKVEGAMQNDVNGIGWSFADIFPKVGVKYLTMGTHGTRAMICFDYPTVFNWESPSGSKVLTFRAEHYMQGNFLGIEQGDFDYFEPRLLEYLLSLEEKGYPLEITSFQFSGYFTDNAPPSTVACEIVKRWNEKYQYPKLRLATPNEFLKTVEEKYADKIPTIRGAWPDWWTDGFGSGAREMATSRKAYTDMTSNSIALSMAKLLGGKIDVAEQYRIDEANKAGIFYGEHTFGYHASISDPFGKNTLEQRSHKMAYAWEAYRRSRSIGETALGLLQSFTPRNEKENSVTIYNPLNWNYTGLVSVAIDHQVAPNDKLVKLVDAQGNSIPMQATDSHGELTYWSIWAENVPALGTKSYTIRVEEQAPRKETVQRTINGVIENQWYKISLDLNKATIVDLYDKELAKNIVSKSNQWEMGAVIYETDTQRDKRDVTHYPSKDVRFESLTRGPIWDSYKFTAYNPAGMDGRNLSVELQVFHTAKQLRMVYCLNKKQVTTPEAVYVSMPFELPDGKIYFDVPGGNVNAGVDQIKGSANDWNMVQNFASVRNNDAQIVLVSDEAPLMQFGGFNSFRMQAGATPQTTHIYSWPMNNYWMTNFNADQHGEFEWTYNITSTKNNSLEYATRFAWNNRLPILARVIRAGVPSKTDVKVVNTPILKLDPATVLLVNMEDVPGENALILHVREIEGKAGKLDVSSAFRPDLKVTPCSVNGTPLAGETLDIKPLETKFVRISW